MTDPAAAEYRMTRPPRLLSFMLFTAADTALYSVYTTRYSFELLDKKGWFEYHNISFNLGVILWLEIKHQLRKLLDRVKQDVCITRQSKVNATHMQDSL